MNRNTKAIVGLVLLVAVLLVAVGYAAITATQLTINGTANATTKTRKLYCRVYRNTNSI